ncbi:MAG: hypothetical protein SF339_07200 [Blastocatellia bacterium]|nr:hypothetical protein [Blastocatellia bacterium]
MNRNNRTDARRIAVSDRLVNRMPKRIFMVLALACGMAAVTVGIQAQKAAGSRMIRLLTRDGKVLEGGLSAGRFTVNGAASHAVGVEMLLSLHLAAEASPHESARITAGLAGVQGADRVARDAAVAELTDIGLPALTPVLNAYKDRDLREPDPLYRLFGRLIPGHADAADRSLDLLRLKNGEALRGRVGVESLSLRVPGGPEMKVSQDSIRWLAVRQAAIEKSFEVHSLRHCTQIEFLDTGVIIGANSRVQATAAGYVRLSFAIDGWASDPDGLKTPGPNYKTNLVDEFPFGALVGKVGVSGPRFLVGRRLDKTGLGEGRLYLAVNDNRHWQNNIGSFRVKLRVTDAYDVGDSQ